jgi:hypothetical protein
MACTLARSVVWPMTAASPTPISPMRHTRAMSGRSTSSTIVPSMSSR